MFPSTMSRHEGVSCDSCMKSNFRGCRYKCLICYDYDLCTTCYEAGSTSTQHTTDHPVQCILTRSDFDMYYGGEALTADHPQSFTCPYCSKMGFTDTTLHEHVIAQHTDVSNEVVCPVCASLPGGDPNHTTDDLATHLSQDHRTPRDFDDPPGLRHVRRIPHPGRGGTSRTRRGNMHFGSSTNTLTGLSPSGRENMDPIAELLSQLSSVRNRAAAAQSVSSQLQQLEMQLQSTRQQLERMPRRQAESSRNAAINGTAPLANPEPGLTSVHSSSASSESQFLLPRLLEETGNTGKAGSGSEPSRVERNIYVQELLLSTMTEQLRAATLSDDPLQLLESMSSPQPHSSQQHASAAGNRGGASSGDVSGTGSPSSTTGREGAGGGKCVVVEGQCKGKAGNGSTAMNMVTGKPSNASGPTASSSSKSPSGPIAPNSRSPMPAQQQGSTVNLNQHAMNSPRSAAANVSRDRMNPAAAKRGLLKSTASSRGATDMDPPPH